VVLFLFSLQLAVTLVQLARLSLEKIAIDLKNAQSDVAAYYLARAQQHSNDAIRFFIRLQFSSLSLF
jgi:hypothetical protein